MAIIVTEERSTANLVRLVGWLGIIGILAAAIYYIFFAAPELVIIPATGNLSAIAPIVNINLSPEDVINSAAFQALKSTVPLPDATNPAPGRSNPFISP